MALMMPSIAKASDFSALGQPAVVRAMLLSVDRRAEVACAAHWIAQRQDQQRAALIDEVRRRLAIDLGDDGVALETLPKAATSQNEVEANRPPDAIGLDPGTLPGNGIAASGREEDGRHFDRERCNRLAAAFDRGGLAAAVPHLAPARTDAIPLPSEGYCLARFERSAMAKEDEAFAARVRKMTAAALTGEILDKDRRASIRRDYAAFDTTPPMPSQPDLRSIDPELGDLLCFPAIAQLTRDLGMER